MPGRDTRLAEVLAECARRVEAGEWRVGQEGVMGDLQELGGVKLSWDEVDDY